MTIQQYQTTLLEIKDKVLQLSRSKVNLKETVSSGRYIYDYDTNRAKLTADRVNKLAAELLIMIEKMLEKTKQYLEGTLSKNEKYLLALSGGPDSMALFHLLLEGGWNFHVCHVDHGWRKESFEEANQLKILAEKHLVPFYLYKIDIKELEEGNLEDNCRKMRFLFFKQEYAKCGFDALLTGHHADDQVETILKRVFEGS